MAIMATFTTDKDFNKRDIFRQKQLERIRNRIGRDNPDQAFKEGLLLNICSKVTSVYIGCFDKIERLLGKEVWAYQASPEEFANFTPEEQLIYRRRFDLWNDCRLSIKELGNKVIDNIIDSVGTFTLTMDEEGEEHE